MKMRIKYLFALMATALLLNALNAIIGLITKEYINTFTSSLLCWTIYEVGVIFYVYQKDDSRKIRKQNNDLKYENLKRFLENRKLKEILKQICFRFNIIASSAEFNRLIINTDSEYILLKILERIETSKAVCNEQKR